MQLPLLRDFWNRGAQEFWFPMLSTILDPQLITVKWNLHFISEGDSKLVQILSRYLSPFCNTISKCLKLGNS
jgi:hypothetical protein